MKKLIIILALLLAPVFCYASWYNPFTWFQRSAPQTNVQTTTVQPINQATNQPEKNDTKVSNKVIENLMPCDTSAKDDIINQQKKTISDMQVQIANMKDNINHFGDLQQTVIDKAYNNCNTMLESSKNSLFQTCADFAKSKVVECMDSCNGKLQDILQQLKTINSSATIPQIIIPPISPYPHNISCTTNDFGYHCSMY